MASQIHEYLIFIHGVSDQNNQSHTPTYDELHRGIQAVRGDFPNRSLWETTQRCDVEWGWNYPPKSDIPQGQRLLAEAQENLAKDVNRQLQSSSDWTLNPLRMVASSVRKLMIQGFSDVAYYASKDGRSSVRAAVTAQILDCIQAPLETGEPISLTFLGHSAGSVIAFDFLFYLFAQDKISEERTFFEEEACEHERQQFDVLRQLARSGKLRVRRLITFGSPISMLTFRNNAVLDVLANDQRLNPSHYGLDQNPEIFGPALANPRWINIWDKDDIIAWPIESLMQHSPSVEDMYVDIGDFLSQTHNAYWNNRGVHRKIAKYW